jgi:hypothetical protein
MMGGCVAYLLGRSMGNEVLVMGLFVCLSYGCCVFIVRIDWVGLG